MFHCLADLSHFLKLQSHVEVHPGNGQTAMKMQGMDGQLRGDHFVPAVVATVLEDLELFLFFATVHVKQKKLKKLSISRI